MQQQAAEYLQQAAPLPAEVCFRFDAAQEDACTGGLPTPRGLCGGVQKTAHRNVVSLQHGQFQACETVRHAVGHGGPVGHRSRQLAAIVAPGAGHAFDLIAHVGVETYVRGRSLQELRAELAGRQPAIQVPRSTLWDQQQRFLFYLGFLHQQAIPCLREYLAQHGPVTWVVDGTTEPETAVFFGIEEAT